MTFPRMDVAPASPTPARTRSIGRREAERILAGSLLQTFGEMQGKLTEFMERWGGRITNHVLEVGTFVFPANGEPLTFSWRVAAGCVVVRAPGHAVTVVAAGPATAGAPTGGRGVWIVPANTKDTIAVASRAVTLYGTSGDVVSVQITTAPLTPVSF